MAPARHRSKGGVPWAPAFVLLILTASCASPSVAVPEDVKSDVRALIQEPPEIDVARDYVLATCMREAGFDVPINLRVNPTPTVANLVGVSGVFGSVQEARDLGYPSSLNNDLGSLTDAFIAGLNSKQAKEYDQAELGDDATATYTLPSGGTASTTTGGCWGRALVAVYGSAENYLQYSTLRNELAPQLSLTDESFGDMASLYSSCMKDSGYSTQSLDETQALAADLYGGSRAPGTPPSPAEAAMASADATCQESAGIPQKLDDLFFSQAGSWALANQDWIVGTLELKSDALERAKSILENPGDA